MYIKTATIVAIYASLSAAQEDPNHPFQAPGEFDARSACPGLNVLANHGYINRNGSQITKEAVIEAQMKAFNFDRATAEGPVDTVLKYSTTLTPSISFNIGDVSMPPLDHDGKLTRNDRVFGDQITFNQTIWDFVLAQLPNDTFTWAQMAVARESRQVQAKRINREYSLFPVMRNASFTQVTGLVAVFGNSIEDGKARTDLLNAMVTEERIPYELGWKRSEKVLGSAELGPILKALIQNTPASS